MTLLFATLLSLCPKPFHHISHHTSLPCLVFNTKAEDICLHILPLGLQHWLGLSWSSCGDPPCFWFAFNHLIYGLPRWRTGKKSACQCRRCKRYRFDPWVWKIPWSRKWQPTPVFLPGQFYGQRSLAGFSPCSYKESGTTERLKTPVCSICCW